MADPVTLLQRLAALHGAGRPLPADLAADVLGWIGGAAGPILNGTPPAEALDLAAQRGAWQNAPVHRARLNCRDTALRDLWRLTTGSDRDRCWTIQEWLDDWRHFNRQGMTGHEARRILADVPAAAREPLDVLLDVALRVPGQRALLRVVRPASSGTDGPESSDSFNLEAPPIAAHGTRT